MALIAAAPVGQYVWLLLAYWTGLCLSVLLVLLTLAIYKNEPKAATRSSSRPIVLSRKRIWIVAMFIGLALHALAVIHLAFGFAFAIAVATACGVATTLLFSLIVWRRWKQLNKEVPKDA
jgi:hypothetical protein